MSLALETGLTWLVWTLVAWGVGGGIFIACALLAASADALLGVNRDPVEADDPRLSILHQPEAAMDRDPDEEADDAQRQA